MSDWPQVPFASLLREPVRNGIYKSKEFHGQGAKIVNMGELFRYPRLHAVEMKRVKLSESELNRFGLAVGDLIFARRSLTAEGAGKCSVILELDDETTFESSIIRARPDRSRADSLFLYYFFSSSVGAHRLDTIRRQVAVAGITGSDLSELRVPAPSITEQKQVASLLGALDDKIELNRRMNETLEAMARAIFRDWFVDFGPTRAKIEGREPYLAPDIWSLFPDRLDEEGKPEGWQSEAVFEQANWVNGAAYKDMHFSSDPDALPVVKIAELKSGITKTTRFTNTDLGGRYKIGDGELLFSWSGNPDTSIDTFVWTSGAAWLNQHIFAVRLNGKRSQSFLYAMLKFLRPQFAEIARNKQTTGLGHVTQQDLIRLKVTIPDREVGAAFEETAMPLHARFTSNLFEIQTLAATRDLLLPKLMSGEIRIRDAEKIAGEAA